MSAGDTLAEIERLLSVVRREQASDPVAFARMLGIEPDPWQVKALRWSGKRLLLNNSRQAGKSTITAVKALHMAVHQPKSLQLLISPSLRQSSELFRKVTDLLAKMPDKAKLTEDNKLSLTLENGARIVSLPSSEATIRGFSSVTRVIEDEAAFVDDAMNVAVRPMLAVSSGEYIMMSTPNGRRGHFFEAWERGGAMWERICVPASEVPRITPEFLESERAEMTRAGNYAKFQQEYECQFVHGATGRVYPGFDEDRNLVDELPELQHYLLGIDYGVIDPCAYVIWGWRDNDPTIYGVKAYKRPGQSPSESAEEVKRLDATYKFHTIVGDVGGLGKAFAEEAMRARFSIPIKAAQKHDKLGNVALFNGDLARGRVKLLREACEPYINELLELSWIAEKDGSVRTVEDPGLENHCCDAGLYGWRATTAYHNEPIAEDNRSTVDLIHDEMAAYWERQERERQERKREESYE